MLRSIAKTKDTPALFFEQYKEKVEQKDPKILEALAKNFKTLEYKDADLRAAAAEKFFRKVLKIKHVEVLRNLDT